MAYKKIVPKLIFINIRLEIIEIRLAATPQRIFQFFYKICEYLWIRKMENYRGNRQHCPHSTRSAAICRFGGLEQMKHVAWQPSRTSIWPHPVNVVRECTAAVRQSPIYSVRKRYCHITNFLWRFLNQKLRFGELPTRSNVL